MGEYILSHDLGTSGNKAAIYDANGKLKGSLLFEYPTHHPHSGWVEQNPTDWWQAVCNSTLRLLEMTKIPPGAISCVSFSAQMMGCLLVDKAGEPLRNMLIWADTRSSKQEKLMVDLLGMEQVYRTTGHRASASYSAAKLLWIKENEPDIYRRAHKMLHVKDYIVWKLTGVYCTDYSDASGTNLLDINKKEWSDTFLSELGIDRSLLPDIFASTHIAGCVTEAAARLTGLLAGTPVVIGGGDGSCACVGAGVVREGRAYSILGSSSWISMASKKPVFDQEMRSFNWIHLDPELYTPCGTMQAAGYSYSWYKNILCKEEAALADAAGISTYEYLNEHLDISHPGAGGLIYLPYLLGERSPRWNHDAKGAFVGLSATTTKADMTRAVLEGVGYNLRMILEILNQKETIEGITMIGGGAKGEGWIQILADIWQRPLYLPEYLEEATSMGAAVCGGVGVGIYRDFRVVEKYNRIDKTIYPNRDNEALYDRFYEVFDDTYKGLTGVYEKLAKIR